RARALVAEVARGRCTLGGAVARAAAHLDDPEVVQEARQLIADWEEALAAFEEWQRSPAAQALLGRLLASGLEDDLLGAAARFDVNAALDAAEGALADMRRREALVNQWKDQALAFLLEYVPDMPVPDAVGTYAVKKLGKKVAVDYHVAGLDLSNFSLRKEDVTVELRDGR
ncbi:unnamed protein product, partial [Heterosigma akashiwo]